MPGGLGRRAGLAVADGYSNWELGQSPYSDIDIHQMSFFKRNDPTQSSGFMIAGILG